MILDHYLLSSVKEYIDRTVTEKLTAYKTATVPLFEQVDSKKPSYKIFGSGPRQWLFDSGISGTIASASTLTDGWENAKVDYKNARVILPTAASTTGDPTSILTTYKFFNSYLTSTSDEDLFFSTEFGSPPELLVADAAAKPDCYHAPCYFVKLGRTMNEGLAIGGFDKTSFDIKLTMFTNTEYEMYGLGGVLRDMSNTICYLLNKTPLDEFNDLKETPWSFYPIMEEMKNDGQLKVFFDTVTFTPIKSDAIKSKMGKCFIGVATIKVFVGRYPRRP